MYKKPRTNLLIVYSPSSFTRNLTERTLIRSTSSNIYIGKASTISADQAIDLIGRRHYPLKMVFKLFSNYQMKALKYFI